MYTKLEEYEKPELWFRTASERRGNYLAAVDQLVLNYARNPMLDVGSGDGIRAMRIAEQANISTLILVEPGDDMFEAANSVGALRVVKAKAEDLESVDFGLKFKIITCLWNVMGNVEHQSRLQALTNMAELLDPEGVIILDVNNKYNVRHYGWQNLWNNSIQDLHFPKPTNGDFSYSVKLNDVVISQTAHFFNLFEIPSLASNAGLKIIESQVLDYATGEKRPTSLEGNLVYVLTK